MANKKSIYEVFTKFLNSKKNNEPTGVDGKDGKDGKDGVNGKDGINGIDGMNGVNGVDGKDGKDGIDGINGVDGKDGLNGKDGKDGINGRDGVDGKSAYEIWLEEGNSGTKSDFLNSLKGENTGGTDGTYENDGYRIKWITQAEYSDLQFNNNLDPKTEYHILDRPTSYRLELVGTELRMIVDGTTMATCDVSSLIQK